MFRGFLSGMKNSFKGIVKNLPAGFVSTASITAIMLILGIILLIVLNVNGVVTKVNENLGEVIVYLFDDTSKSDIEGLLNELKVKEEVKTLTYISKDQAIEEAKNTFKGENLDLSKLRTNPFPASIKIELDNISYAEELVNKLSNDDRIEKIRYYKEPIQKFIKTDKVIKLGGLIAFVAMLLGAVFIISNIIRMAIASRGSEIEIMKYVGASELFIKGPFIFEGVFFSTLGCIISYFILINLYNKFYELFFANIYEYISYGLININDIKTDILIIFISTGIGVGLTGSLLSIRKYLRV